MAEPSIGVVVPAACQHCAELSRVLVRDGREELGEWHSHRQRLDPSLFRGGRRIRGDLGTLQLLRAPWISSVRRSAESPRLSGGHIQSYSTTTSSRRWPTSITVTREAFIDARNSAHTALVCSHCDCDCFQGFGHRFSDRCHAAIAPSSGDSDEASKISLHTCRRASGDNRSCKHTGYSGRTYFNRALVYFSLATSLIRLAVASGPSSLASVASLGDAHRRNFG
jgi:hypothetical protein